VTLVACLAHIRCKFIDVKQDQGKIKIGEAISYSLNQFKKFQRYLEDGRFSIDNIETF